MLLLRISLVLAVAILTAMMSGRIAAGIGDRVAIKQLARWSSAPADQFGRRWHADVDDAEYRAAATARAKRIGWVVWATSVILGVIVGLIMGRGGLHIGKPKVEPGKGGVALLVVQIVLTILVLWVARLLERVAGRFIAISYTAAVAGVITGALVAIPITLILTLFARTGPLAEIEVALTLRVALLCGTMTIVAVAVMLAPMITPAPRD